MIAHTTVSHGTHWECSCGESQYYHHVATVGRWAQAHRDAHAYWSNEVVTLPSSITDGEGWQRMRRFHLREN
jgi:hypothetical protein